MLGCDLGTDILGSRCWEAATGFFVKIFRGSLVGYRRLSPLSWGGLETRELDRKIVHARHAYATIKWLITSKTRNSSLLLNHS